MKENGVTAELLGTHFKTMWIVKVTRVVAEDETREKKSILSSRGL